MNCIKCGASNVVGKSFCEHCGASLTREDNYQSAQQNIQPQHQFVQPQQQFGGQPQTGFQQPMGQQPTYPQQPYQQPYAQPMGQQPTYPQQPYQQPYAQPPYGQYPVQTRTSAALWVGIAAIISLFVGMGVPFFGFVSFVLSIVALSIGARDRKRGAPGATAGFVIGLVLLILTVLGVIVVVVFLQQFLSAF